MLRVYKATKIEQPEVVVETFNTRGNWATKMNGVRLTHTPTGTVVECDSYPSVHKNKIVAMDALKNALLATKLNPGDEND